MNEYRKKQLVSNRYLNGCVMILASVLFAAMAAVREAPIERVVLSVVPIAFFLAGAWCIFLARRNSA
jgi:hypothetical protein